VGNLTSKISFSWICMTNLLPMKSHVTIKYCSILMTSYRDVLTKNRKCSKVRLGQGPWPVARLPQLVGQQIGVPRLVDRRELTISSPMVVSSCSYAKPFFKKHLPFLVILFMILKLNLTLYFGKNSLFLMKL